MGLRSSKTTSIQPAPLGDTRTDADRAERRARGQETRSHVREESRQGVSVIMFNIGSHAPKENANHGTINRPPKHQHPNKDTTQTKNGSSTAATQTQSSSRTQTQAPTQTRRTGPTSEAHGRTKAATLATDRTGTR